MNEAALTTLGTKAASMMMQGAVSFLHSRGLKAADVDLDRVVVELKARSAAAIDAAMRDARAALEIPGMDKVAEATFAATMRHHGIEAAKAAIGGAA